MSRTTRPQTATQIESVRHRDKRANIPTEELRDFVAEDEAAPTTMLYPRDPSLDPQLVWRGKDEQDSADLAVQTVPIYIQEKVDPHALVEDLRRAGNRQQATGNGAGNQQLDLFASFDSDAPVAFEDMVDFYHHEQNWANRMILGDSLLVMTSLAEKEGLKGKVQTIYLDPPYGIRFGSNWQVSTRKRDVKDGRAEDLTRQPEQVKAFRDTWQLGIHSYLAYLRDRLVVARELLTESGSIFVQIGDENVHLVRCVMDEVFGSENFVSQISFVTTTSQTSEFVSPVFDYVIWYSKARDHAKFRELHSPKNIDDSTKSAYARFEVNGQMVDRRPSHDDWSLFVFDNLTSRSGGQSTTQPFEYQGQRFSPRSGGWKTSTTGLGRLARAGRVFSRGSSAFYKRYFNDFPLNSLSNQWLDTQMGGFGKETKVYAVQTNTKVMERCILMTTDPGDLVLDPTCGSGTTAYVAEQWGRRWITVDTSRVALALARTRLMGGRFPYYLLADSPEGQVKEREVGGVAAGLDGSGAEVGRSFAAAQDDKPGGGDIRKGFVYKRVPHITLKSIANNPEIDGIHARYQERLEPLRAELNRALGVSWEEWEVPRELPGGDAGDSPNRPYDRGGNGRDAGALLAEWWELRRERQREIDASIARRADTEVLYDQPYEDSKRVRVTGPFTVESLSPHRVLPVDDAERPESEDAGRRDAALSGDQFETTILEHLRKAGVQNTVRDERLKFERLENFAGEYLHAVGEYTTKDGAPQRVAVSIGPEHGTVGSGWIKDAAKEAMRGVGFDLLLVCAFSFDANAGETAKELSPTPSPNGHEPATFMAETPRQYGKLQVLPVRMNPDLAMGDELLKNTGAGNLFMVFGEPDLDVTTGADGNLTVEIRGVDVYDPTTGQIRSSSTDDIACWFIDTDYNEESFFVRHAYFTGADQPYDKLKRALRAEIDEAAWAQLYSTTSRPFPAPSTGKIAVKVINHYGDEVLKVYGV